MISAVGHQITSLPQASLFYTTESELEEREKESTSRNHDGMHANQPASNLPAYPVVISGGFCDLALPEPASL
jgi:hypothetical protein